MGPSAVGLVLGGFYPDACHPRRRVADVILPALLFVGLVVLLIVVIVSVRYHP